MLEYLHGVEHPCHKTTACGLTRLESSDTLGVECGNVRSAWKACD